jgi:hypothetical protein
MWRIFQFLFLIALVAAVSGCQDKTTVHGLRGREMIVTIPDEIELAPGQSRYVMVIIDRKGFSGPVAVSLDHLPKGVSMDQDQVMAAGDEARILLSAESGAYVGGMGQVAVEGPDDLILRKSVPIQIRPERMKPEAMERRHHRGHTTTGPIGVH